MFLNVHPKRKKRRGKKRRIKKKRNALECAYQKELVVSARRSDRYLSTLPLIPHYSNNWIILVLFVYHNS